MSEEWKEQARDMQQNFAVYLSNRVWDRFTSDQGRQLRQKIGFALFGPPQRDNGSYAKEEEELVSELEEKCRKCYKESSKGSSDVILAFLFVCAYKDRSTKTTVPLIRVKKNSGRNPRLSYFIDHTGRVYKDWGEFLEDNIFSGWWICLPKDGMYSFTDEVQLEFHDQTKRGNVVKELDEISSVAGLVTSIGLLTGLALSVFPPTSLLGIATVAANSIVATPVAVYGTGRSVGKLIDRGTHDQSINPFISNEARSCWLTTAASLLSVGTISSGYMLASKAAAGGVISSGTRALCTALNMSSLSVSGLGVINAFYELANKDKVTSLDILQLSLSVLFFTHSTVTFKTANDIIRNAQKATIKQQRNSFHHEERADFDSVLGAIKDAYGRDKKMHANAEFIQNLGEFESPIEFLDRFKLRGKGTKSAGTKGSEVHYDDDDVEEHFNKRKLK